MSWVDARDSAIDALVRWNRRRRGVREMEPWRVKRALEEGIRFSDDELLQAWQAATSPPLWSANEYRRAA